MVSHPQTPQKIALEPWEVGGELLDILSRGLYTDARDALREYVQNSVDAHASTVHVTIDGPVITVRDDGDGMDFDTLRRARRLGASDKSPQFNVGFRGIGIYAAFGMCETLTIHTHQANAAELLRLRLHFGAMGRVLEKDRDAPKRSGVALTDLLYEHTDFQRTDYTGDPTEQFTMVRLEGVRPEHRAQLSKLAEVHSYLLSTLPVAFPESGYGFSVNNWLRDIVKLHPVRIVLRVGKEPEVLVAPQLARNVREPETNYIKDADGRDLAFMWYALSTTGSQVSSDHGATNNYDISGFHLKIKGFTLGNRQTVRHLWPLVGGRALYHHYTGEIHVLDDAGVVPNAARNDLSAGRPRDVLFRYLEDNFNVLNSQADVARQLLKIQGDVATLEKQAENLRQRQDNPDESPFELYRLSRNFVLSIERSERELTRLKGRGRSGRSRMTFPPTQLQLQEIDKIFTLVREPKEIASRVVRATSTRTRSKSSDVQPASQQPPLPQVALLRQALDAFAGMHDRLPGDRFAGAHEALESALRFQLVAPAVAVLDDLKAEGYSLVESLETSRRELRSYLGWSANAPVSLAEALAEEGFLPSTTRESALIQALDDGLRSGLGGRGEAYENLLRAIAAAVSANSNLG